MRKENRKALFLLLGLLLIGIALIFSFYIIKRTPYLYGGDLQTQWYPFYLSNKRETLNALKNGTLPFYSWSVFLGNNIWASRSYYGLFDLYNILTYPLPVNYFYLYDLMSILKVLVSGLSFFLLLDYQGYRKKSCIMGGICFAFSSFALFYMGQSSFLSFYSLMPLYLLGMEKYLRENKKAGFILIAFILILTDWYFFYALSAFSPLYYIYRYYNIHGELKGFFKNALGLIGCYLIGILLSGMFFFPAVIYTLGNERVGRGASLLTFDSLSTYFHIFVSALVPSHDYLFHENVFYHDAHTMREIFVYAGSAIALLAPQFVKDRDEKYRKSTMIMYLVLFLFFLIPMGDSIFNGLSQPCFRWTYFIMILNIFNALRYWERGVDLSLLKKSLWAELVLIPLCFFGALLTNNYHLQDYLPQLALFSMAFGSLVIYYFLLKKGWNRVVFVLTFLELCFCGFVFVKGNYIEDRFEVVNQASHVLEYEEGELNDHFDSLDGNEGEFYRFYVDKDACYWDISHNLNLVADIKGLTTYDSAFEPGFAQMRDVANEEIVEGMPWQFNIREKDLIKLLSVKYAIVTSKEMIPFENYELIEPYHEFLVAENLDYRPLGVTYHKLMSRYSFVYENNSTPSILLDNVVTLHDKEELEQLVDPNGKTAFLENISYMNNSLSASVNSDKDSFVVLSLPYEKGWNLKINGEKEKIYDVNCGLMGFGINAGENIIELRFVPEGFSLGLFTSALGCILFIVIIGKEKRWIRS